MAIDLSKLSRKRKEELLILLEEKRRRYIKSSFIRFLEVESEGRWKRARHLELLCSIMEDVSAGRKKRVIVTLPPRHGKSEVISKKFPAWHLGNYPDDEIILASYSLDLARDFSLIARETLRQNKHIFGIDISKASAAADHWTIAGHRGGLVAAGVGGPITGRGSRILLIDDPVKNAEEANSETVREKIWQWYATTAYTRLTPDGAIVIVMTRWHEDDLVGRLLKKQEQDEKEGIESDRWEVVNLPADAEENDILGRKPGEPLWPEYGFDRERLDKIKHDIGSYAYSALYQQRPSPAGGSIFKRQWFRYFDEEDDHFILYTDIDQKKRVKKTDCWCFQTVDAAITKKEENDYFVLATWYATRENDLLLYDLVRTHIEGPEQRTLMMNAHKRFDPVFQAVEDKTFGTNLIQEMKRQGLPVKPVDADTDKVTRALPVSVRYEIGSVYHRAGAEWLSDFENELLAFPNGKNDDCVDATSYAGLLLKGFIGDADAILAGGFPSYGRGRRDDDDDDDDDNRGPSFYGM